MARDARHVFVQGDLGDTALVSGLLALHKPRAVLNFAAESDVDRSIHGSGEFIHTNIVHLQPARVRARLLGRFGRRCLNGFQVLARLHRRGLWLLGQDRAGLHQAHPHEPNSPYSASNAASDQLVRAYTTPTACRC